MITLQQLIEIGMLAVVAQAMFVGAEIALGSCDRARLRQRAGDGSRGARAAERLLARQETTAATVLIGATAASLTLAATCAVYLAGRGINEAWAALVVLVPMVIFGHLVPKAIAGAHADRLVSFFSIVLVPVSWVMRPLVLVVSAFAGAATRLAGTDKKKAFITRDELALIIESEPAGDKASSITADEREMIANVFELSEYKVGDLMVPLSEVTALPEDTTLGEAALEVSDKQHSRMPVYRGRVDDIVGIVTVEDLLETIVGDIDDEYDDEPSPIRQEKPGIWRVEAKITVAKLNQALDLGIPESDDYETIAGFLIERFRRIPTPGSQVQVGGASIEVVAATDRAVEAVRITKRKR
jgi:CBS domain containing-hemolysin-like protein